MRATIIVLALPSASLIAQSGPSHHWHLDEASGTVAADIQGGSHGVLQGGMPFSPGSGWFGGACLFDGADDRIAAGPCDITTGTGGFSISLWVKLQLMAGSEQVILARTDGPGASGFIWSLSQVNSTALRFRLRTNGAITELTTAGSSLFSGAWYHVACTYDGTDMRIVINGALVATAPKTGLLPFAPASPTTFGGRSDGTLSYMGWLDDVRLYDHGLSDPEIFDLLLGDVSTDVQEPIRVSVDSDGSLRLPLEGWRDASIIDPRGRTVVTGIVPGVRPSLRDLSPGAHLVCLRAGAHVTTIPFVVP